MTEPDSFQWYPLAGQNEMGTNWNTGGSIWTSGNTVKVTEHRHRLPREAVESPRLDIFRNSRRGPGQAALGDPAQARGLDQLISRGPWQPQPLCHLWGFPTGDTGWALLPWQPSEEPSQGALFAPRRWPGFPACVAELPMARHLCSGSTGLSSQDFTSPS